jgi:hypothetical protein
MLREKNAGLKELANLGAESYGLDVLKLGIYNPSTGCDFQHVVVDGRRGRRSHFRFRLDSFSAYQSHARSS